MKLPDEVTVKCGMCGAEHKVLVSYTEEIRDNAITFRIHAQLTPDFTRHVARTHLMVDGLPQVLTDRGAESSDDPDAERGAAGDGEGAGVVGLTGKVPGWATDASLMSGGVGLTGR